MATLLSPGVSQNLSALQERAGYPYYYPTPNRLLSQLDELTSTLGAATVLADQDLSVVIPAYASNANIVAHRVPTTSEIFPADRQQEALQRLIDQDTFFRSRYLTEDAVDVLNRYDVGYVIASSGSDLDIQMRLAPEWFEWIVDDQSYSLVSGAGVADVDAQHRGQYGPGRTTVGHSRVRCMSRRWMRMRTICWRWRGWPTYHRRADSSPDAISHYEEILRRADLPVVNYRLGNIYRDLGQIERAIAEYDVAQQTAPQVSRFHTALGDVCLSAGRDMCAEEQYTAAVASQNLPDEAARLVAQADMWRQRGPH